MNGSGPSCLVPSSYRETPRRSARELRSAIAPVSPAIGRPADPHGPLLQGSSGNSSGMTRVGAGSSLTGTDERSSAARASRRFRTLATWCLTPPTSARHRRVFRQHQALLDELGPRKPAPAGRRGVPIRTLRTSAFRWWRMRASASRRNTGRRRTPCYFQGSRMPAEGLGRAGGAGQAGRMRSAVLAFSPHARTATAPAITEGTFSISSASLTRRCHPAGAPARVPKASAPVNRPRQAWKPSAR